MPTDTGGHAGVIDQYEGKEMDDVTRVMFRRFADGAVIALFPDIAESRGCISSYMCVGQHGEASRDLIRELPEATPDEYAALKNELESAPFCYRLSVVQTPPRVRTVAQAIHSALVAIDNCEKAGNREWKARWQEYVARIAKECLPSGAGIDNGTRIVSLTSGGRGITLEFSFHHMTDNGFYDGWTEHTATVYPSFTGLDIRIRGKRLTELADYLHDTFNVALSAELPAHIQP
jgi:hypothetical protein